MASTLEELIGSKYNTSRPTTPRPLVSLLAPRPCPSSCPPMLLFPAYFLARASNGSLFYITVAITAEPNTPSVAIICLLAPRCSRHASVVSLISLRLTRLLFSPACFPAPPAPYYNPLTPHYSTNRTLPLPSPSS